MDVPSIHLQITSEIQSGRETAKLIDLDQGIELFEIVTDSASNSENQPHIYAANYGFIPQHFDNSKIPREDLITFAEMENYSQLRNVTPFVEKFGHPTRVSATVDHQRIFVKTNQVGLDNPILEPHSVRFLIFKKNGELEKIVNVDSPALGQWAHHFVFMAVDAYMSHLISPLEDPAELVKLNHQTREFLK